MSRSHALALAALAALLSSAAPSAAQTLTPGAQCVPAVAQPGLYTNCRLAQVQGNLACRCEVRPQALGASLRQESAQESARGALRLSPAPAALPRGSAAGAGDGGRPLTAAELRQMYSGRTWMWSEGGGYFDPSGTFYGAVGNSATSAFLARGSWRAGNQGEMCFQALWNGQVGKNDERTCFYHKAEGGRILQRKGTSGEWYTFRSAPARRSDEFNKLVQGNQVSTKMGDLRARFLYGLPL